MKFDLTKYAKIIKYLTVIPILTGLLTLLDLFIPQQETNTIVISKNESVRARFGNTTYNIYFENLNDQFNEEVYRNISEDEPVNVKHTVFTKEISEVTSLKSNITYTKETSEAYFVYGLGLLFFLTGLIWFKPRKMSAKEAKYLIIIIFISAFSLIRILKHL